MFSFICGLIVGTSVSLLTVVTLKIFSNDKFLDNHEYKIEISSGGSYRSGKIKFKKIDK